MRTLYRHSRFRRLVAAVLMLGIALDAPANPTGMTVRGGSATASSSGSQLTVTATSQNTFLNWQSFNIAAGETTIFQEPSSTSIVWNQINNANPSQIYGSLQANGIVVLLNSSGFYFGPNSFVSAAGLVVSTANYLPPQNSGGGWEFNGPPPLASIVNYGQIKIGNGGSAFLIADQVENHGSITAPGGTIGLAAGQTVLLSDRPDGRGMSMQVTLPSGSVDNEGRLIADGGTIAMNARVVNQDGFIQANSVKDVNGTIELVAADQLTLGANSQISASGDNSSGGSAGGNVTLQSGNNFSDSTGSQIITTGGAQGGNGGNVEISAPSVQSLNSSIDARAQAGWTAGKLLLDPDYIILDTSGSGSAGSGTVLAGSNPGSTLDLNVNSAFANLAVSQIILQAVYDITLTGGTSWDLSGTIGANLGGVTSGQLTLEAGRNIIFGNGSQITDANNWSATLEAGYNFANNTIQSGQGNIYLNGGSGQSGIGSIQLSQGSINLTAGNSIVVGSGCQLIDDGSTIGLYAQTVSQYGLIQANSVGNQHGVIELVASDSLALGANSQITANGDNSASGSAGGQIMLQTAQTFSDVAGSQVSADGGANGGNGGRILIYAAQSSVYSSLYVSAPAGSIGNVYYYTPFKNLTLTASTLAPFAGFSSILLQASGNITLPAGEVDLGAGSGQLTLEAGKNIIFQDGSSIVDANDWSVTLDAGYNFTTESVVSTVGTSSSSTAGNIYLNGVNNGTGSGSIQLSQGSVNLEAGNGVQIGSGTVSAGAGAVTWLAGGDIQFGDGSQITVGSGAVTLDAGYSFVNNAVQSGSGSIYLNGGLSGDGIGGSIQTGSGDIYLTAGQNILVGSGYVITTGGGSISAHALAGNIDTGSDAQGYHFSGSPVSSLSQAYNLQDGLGGISTAAGGDVTLIAGGDVTSFLPGNQSPGNPDYATAGSGAYGHQLGNITIVAGGNVTGNYLVANGTGAIYAGVKMVNGIPVDANGNPVTDGKSYVLDSPTGSAGTADNELALNLITGGWTVNAAQNIYLQEVRNPNGVFDISAGRSNVHYFDYAPGDYVDLNAGNLVQLGASASVLPRPTGILVPFIYPSILNINAGAGGVELVGDSEPFNQLILFPSPQGSLTINTTDGGSLYSGLAPSGEAPQIFYLIVSDSGSHQLTASSSDQNCTFGISDFAASPIHAATSTDPNNSTPIDLNISGDMSLVLLAAPEAAQINVAGNMYNCRFQGMNLYANDVTSITVGGDIINRGNFTSVDLNQAGVPAPDMDYLSEAYGYYLGNNFYTISPATLISSLFYNKDTHVLTYQNITGMSIAEVLYILQNLYISTGVDADGNPIKSSAPVSVLTAATAQALLDQYNAENEACHIPDGMGPPDSTYGYTIGGGGQFNITARTIDLGTTAGIQSDGVGGPYEYRGGYPLASLFGDGGVFAQSADITITTTGDHDGTTAAGESYGDLDMYSSSIASLQGGDITIYAGGDINAGSADFSVNTTSARGIYSTDLGNVFVYANGDINVNGSRIAVYDTRQSTDNSSGTPGGSVTVVSRNGNIDAGNGGSGFVSVSSYLVNPNQSVAAYSQTIPGSGIMEVSYTENGNILVEAPNGTVNASAGGILQILLNGPPLPESTTLFGIGLNHRALAKMFDLALTGKTKTALALQTVLNGNPGNCVVDIFAGYELQQLDGTGNPILDAYGDPLITALNLADGTLMKSSDNQDIDARGSGVLGAGTVNLNASGSVAGNIYGGNVNIAAVNNADVNVLAVGTANVSANSLENSKIVGLQGVDATGDSSSASLFSNDQVSGGQNSMAVGTAADAASQGAASETSASPVKSDDTTSTDDDEKKKKGKVALVQKTGRVTVILPPRQQSQVQTLEPRT
ncbi:MAG: filamentous hemagglutinin N-terminal domain-containing protein [Verrucomicrobiota bacterium]